MNARSTAQETKFCIFKTTNGEFGPVFCPEAVVNMICLTDESQSYHEIV